jgi:hypothetical protein
LLFNIEGKICWTSTWLHDFIRCSIKKTQKKYKTQMHETWASFISQNPKKKKKSQLKSNKNILFHFYTISNRWMRVSRMSLDS